MQKHRKTKKTYNIPDHAHFLTFSCFQRRPLLSSDRTRRWFLDAVSEMRQTKAVQIWAYVIMPEHVHLLIRPEQPQYKMSEILASLKRPVSRRAKEYLIEENNTEWLTKLTVTQGKRSVFRFWQPGGGYDHNLWNDKPLEQVIEYIHANPVRRGLVEQVTDWYWSSARFYETGALEPLTIDPILEGLS